MKCRLYIVVILSMLTAWVPIEGRGEYPFRHQTGYSSDGSSFWGMPAVTNLSVQPESDTLLYRYLQLKSIPDSRLRHQLEEQGLQFISYEGDFVYLISFPQGFRWEGAVSSWRDSLSVPRPSMLPFEFIPGSTQGTIEENQWLVKFYPGLSAGISRLAHLLTQKGWEVTSIEPELDALVIRASETTIQALSVIPYVRHVEPVVPHRPENWVTVAMHNAHLPAAAVGIPLLEGKDVQVAVGDDGFVETHLDLIERLQNVFTIKTDDQGQHADLVAGLIGGNGNINPGIRGLAPGSLLHILNDFDAVKTLETLQEDHEVTVTCTAISDGCNRGYSALAHLSDRQIREDPEVMHIFSAGNAGTEDCLYGAGSGWGTITGGVKLAKNILTVGFLDNSGEAPVASSKGPASDGRIKPELVAYGSQLASTAAGNTYGSISGTSAAAAILTGIWAQLTEGYRALFEGRNPPSALLKAILLNTATDLGNPGPDYTYGFGRPNAGKAWEILQGGQFQYDTIDNNEVKTFSLFVPDGKMEARALLYWHDYEGSLASKKALVNDLDLLLISPSGDSLLPLCLNSTPDPALLDAPAIPGIDSLNNVEQVRFVFPESGDYTVRIKGSEVPFGPQPYVLTWYFVNTEGAWHFPAGGEKLVPGEVIPAQWSLPSGPTSASNYQLQYSLDDGITWIFIKNIEPATSFLFWQSPHVFAEKAKFRLLDNTGKFLESPTFSLLPAPDKPDILRVCGTSVLLGWSPVGDAVSYQVYQLTGSAMDSIATTAATQLEIPVDGPDQEHWFAVSAIFDNALHGRRSEAVSDGTTLLNCDLENDLAVWKVQVPGGNAISTCFEGAVPVTILLANEGINPQATFQLCYSIDKEEPICEVSQVIVPPGANYLFTFNAQVNLSVGQHELAAWPSVNKDEAPYNDTAFTIVNVYSGFSHPLPYYQNFDDFPLSDPFDDCQSSYFLPENWINDANTLGDDTDWRGWGGATPTAGTGPLFDQNTHSDAGRYLYLESSRGCYEQAANLITPCLDLTGTLKPKMSFWYHLFGADAGSLHVDLYDGTSWTPNITPPLIGDQGEGWQKVEIDLSAFVDHTIMIRFRGYTGAGYLSDMALDNIAFFDASSAPFANFVSQTSTTCPEHPVQFFDNSINDPDSWFWEISPPAFVVEGSSTMHDQNPVVSFLQPGAYSVKLTVRNNFGSSTAVKEDVIQIVDGIKPPYRNSFENPDHFNKIWKNQNPDNSVGWSLVEVTGRDGNVSRAFHVNNHHYPSTGERDVLQSPTFDLSGLQHPTLRLDLAYAPYSENFEDEFILQVSTDCNLSFEQVLFRKKGGALATTSAHSDCWYPESRGDWRNEEIDLSAFAGMSVSFQLINVCGYGNNLFIDNLWIGEKQAFPNAEFRTTNRDSIFCSNTPVTFYIQPASLDKDTIVWNFGSNAQPSQARGPGPHTVLFDSSGYHSVLVFSTNANGFDWAEKKMRFIEPPVASFSAHQAQNKVQFVNHSKFADFWVWSFGDGTISEEENPLHVFAGSGNYLVTLRAGSVCGTSTAEQKVALDVSGFISENGLYWEASPNPATHYALVTGWSPIPDVFRLSLFDYQGKEIYHTTYETFRSGWFSFRIDTDRLPAGTYSARLTSSMGYHTEKIVVRR